MSENGFSKRIVGGLEGEVPPKCQDFEPDHPRYSSVTSSEESTEWQSSV